MRVLARDVPIARSLEDLREGLKSLIVSLRLVVRKKSCLVRSLDLVFVLLIMMPSAMIKARATMPPMMSLRMRPVKVVVPLVLTGRFSWEIWLRYSRLFMGLL